MLFFSVFKGVLVLYSVFEGVLVLYSVFQGVLVLYSVLKGVLVPYSVFLGGLEIFSLFKSVLELQGYLPQHRRMHGASRYSCRPSMLRRLQRADALGAVLQRPGHEQVREERVLVGPSATGSSPRSTGVSATLQLVWYYIVYLRV